MGTPLPGTVIAAEITTGNTDNTFSIGDTNQMQGGHHSVTTLNERDAITVERRRVGMTCWVSGTINAMYLLATGINNVDWTLTQSGTVSLVAEQGTRSEADQYLQNQIIAISGSTSGSMAMLLEAEAGTRSFRDQFLQNQITLNESTEQGTRSSADQFLQNQVTTQIGINTSQQTQLDSLFALLGVSFSGTFAWWMSQIRGGLTDTKLNVINGIVAGVTESTFAWEDFEFYGTGSIGSGNLNLGTAWNGAGILVVSPIPGVVAEETYTGLTDGPITTIPSATGTGWSNAGTLGAETTTGFYGSDTFDTYSTGTVVTGQINAGFDWSGTATIYAR